jgi:hypothetical protein
MNAYIRDIESRSRAPLTGYVSQTARAEGLSSDDWAGPQVRVPLRAKSPVQEVVVTGWRADAAPQGTFRLEIDGNVSEVKVSGGMFEAKLKLAKPATGDFTVAMNLDAPGNGLPQGADSRDLAFRLVEVRALHAGSVKWI